MSENQLIIVLCSLTFFTGLNTLYIILDILNNHTK